MNKAIILAGGTGRRMEQDIPKQFIFVDDKPIIIYTLEKFQNSLLIDEIYVACIDGWDVFLKTYAKQFNITKLQKVVKGGDCRKKSIKNVVDLIRYNTNDDDLVLIFDANRPFINDNMISDAIEKCKIYGAAAGARSCYETMFRDEDKTQIISSCDDRSKLYIGTGPVCVKYGTSYGLLEKYCDKDEINTLEEMLINSHIEIAISYSSEKCIKLTTIEDIELMRALLKVEKYEWLK